MIPINVYLIISEQQMENDNMYQMLQQQIKNNRHQNVYQIANALYQKQNNQQLKQIIGVALCKLQSHKNNFLETPLITAYHYYLTNNQMILKIKGTSQEIDLIIAQYLFANRRYQQAYEMYEKASKKGTLKHIKQDIQTNLMAINSCLPNPHLLSKPSSPSFQYLFNKCLCVPPNKRQQVVRQMYKNRILTQSQQKYMRLLYGEINVDGVNQKWLNRYKEFVDRYNKDGMAYGVAIKKLQELHGSGCKQTTKQHQYFQLNKLLLLLQKDKIQQATKIYQSLVQKDYIHDKTLDICGRMIGKQIEVQGTEWISMESMTDQQVCKKIMQMCQSKQYAHKKQQLYLILLKSPKLSAHIAPSFLQTISKSPPSRLYNQILQKLLPIYPLNEKQLEELQESKQRFSGYMYVKGMLNIDINKCYQRLKEEVGKRDQAERLIDEVLYIKKDQKNKNNFMLKKKIKKKKRKIRYPKNFDPENPGPLPNPQRWLPKWERKQFRKRKHFKGGKTQGSSNTTQQYANYQFAPKKQQKRRGKNKK